MKRIRKVAIYLGCLTFVFGMFSSPASAALDITILAVRQMDADPSFGILGREYDLCLLNSQLIETLTDGTSNHQAHTATDIAVGRIHGLPGLDVQAVMTLNELPKWGNGYTNRGFCRIFNIINQEIVTIFTDTPSSNGGYDGPGEGYYLMSVITADIAIPDNGTHQMDDVFGPRDEFIFTGFNPIHDNLTPGSTYPEPRVVGIIIEDHPLDGRGGKAQLFQSVANTQSGSTPFGLDYGMVTDLGGGERHVVTANAYGDNRMSYDIGAFDGNPTGLMGPNTLEPDEGGYITQYYGVSDNVSFWWPWDPQTQGDRGSNDPGDLQLKVQARDVALGDVDGDGLEEIAVTLDGHMVVDIVTGQPGKSYVALHDGWKWDGVSAPINSWPMVTKTAEFVGGADRICEGQFDADPASEFVVLNLLYDTDNVTVLTSQFRIYDDNGTGAMPLIRTKNIAGHITAMETYDWDGDGLSEIVVGRLLPPPSDNYSVIELYSTTALLLDQSNKTYGHSYTPIGAPESVGQKTWFTALAITMVEAKVLPDPDNCSEVWSMGYGMQTDLDFTCKIDWGDFSVFASQWLFDECGASADFDGSCLVDWGDFSIFASTWLDCNDPEDMPPCIANW